MKEKWLFVFFFIELRGSLSTTNATVELKISNATNLIVHQLLITINQFEILQKYLTAYHNRFVWKMYYIIYNRMNYNSD